MKTEITRSEYQQLIGATAIARKHDGIIRELLQDVGRIIGEDEPELGHSSDLCYSDENVDAWLKTHKISIVDEEATQ